MSETGHRAPGKSPFHSFTANECIPIYKYILGVGSISKGNEDEGSGLDRHRGEAP